MANPTDLVKVRLQTDGQMKGADGKYLPKKYTGMGHAFTSIVKDEGVLGLWKGVGPTCGRATALAAAELATYDEVKSRFLHSGIFSDGLACTLATAFVSDGTPAHPRPRARRQLTACVSSTCRRGVRCCPIREGRGSRHPSGSNGRFRLRPGRKAAAAPFAGGWSSLPDKNGCAADMDHSTLLPLPILPPAAP